VEGLPSTGASSLRVPAPVSSPVDRAAQGQRELPNGCPTAARHKVTAPLLPSPLGAPSGPSVTRVAARPICCPAFQPWGASLASPAWDLLCPLLTSADRSERLPPPSVPRRDRRQISQGKTQNGWRSDAGFIQPTPLRMEDFAVIPPVAGLAPGVPHPAFGGIPVRRPARWDWASSRPHLTVTPLPFS